MCTYHKVKKAHLYIKNVQQNNDKCNNYRVVRGIYLNNIGYEACLNITLAQEHLPQVLRNLLFC